MANLLTTKEVAEKLNCHPQSIYKNKELPFVKIPGIGKRYDESEVNKVIEKKTIRPPIKPLNVLHSELTDPLERPINNIGGLSEMAKKAKSKTRFPIGYGGYVYIREYPSGKKSWGIVYRDENNVRKSPIVRNAQTYEDAVIALKKAQRDVFDRQYNIKRKKGRIKFNEFADMYFEDYAKVNKTSWKADRSYLKSLKKFFGGFYVDEIDTQLVAKYKPWRLKQKVPNRNTFIKKATVDRCLAILSRMFTLAVEWGYLEKNQIPKIKLFSENNQKQMVLAKEQDKVLFQKLNEIPEYFKSNIVVALNTGLRKGRVRNLEWSQVNFETRKVTVKDTKSKKTIIIDMNKTLLQELLKLKNLNGNSPYVFCNPKTGKPYVINERTLKKAFKLAGLEGMRYHDFRHTFASRVVESGASMPTTRDLLGHSSVKMTERYAHSNEDQKKKAVESLDNYGVEKEPKKNENRDNLSLNCHLEKPQNESKALSYLFSGECDNFF